MSESTDTARMEHKGDEHQGDSPKKQDDSVKQQDGGLQLQDDGLQVVHESGLEVVHPGMGAFHNVSTLPEVSYPPPNAWNQQPEKTNSWYNQQSTYQTSPAPGYAAVPTTPGTVAVGLDNGNGTKGGRICGMRRKVFFIVLAVVIFVVVLGIAVGLGVGLGLRKNSDSDNSDKISVPSTVSANITCPGADNTTYQADGTKRFFQVICGVDYDSNDGAVDLTSQDEDSMAACIDECASKDDCTAAGWGNYFDHQVCFLKKSVGSSHEADGWMFTKEVDDPNGS